MLDGGKTKNVKNGFLPFFSLSPLPLSLPLILLSLSLILLSLSLILLSLSHPPLSLSLSHTHTLCMYHIRSAFEWKYCTYKSHFFQSYEYITITYMQRFAFPVAMAEGGGGRTKTVLYMDSSLQLHDTITNF